VAVALAAHHASRGERVEPQGFVAEFADLVPSADRLQPLLEQMADSVAAGQTTGEFAEALGMTRGVSGFVLHTVPVVLHAWLRNQYDYRGAVSEVIGCGGDTDTTAAIVGGIVGAAVGPEGIPAQWQRSLWEWPRTIRWLELLAHRLTEVRQSHQPGRPPRLPAYGVLPRNAVFATVVLAHGFRRLLPPY
jgi:ADP-ribosylglycohydrolase